MKIIEHKSGISSNLNLIFILPLALSVLTGFAFGLGLGEWILLITFIACLFSFMLVGSLPWIILLVILSLSVWSFPQISIYFGFKAFPLGEIGLILVGVPFLIRALANGKFRIRSKFSFLFLLYAVIFVLAIVRSPIPSFSRFALDGSKEIYNFLIIILFYFVITNLVTSERHLILFLRGLFWGAFVGVLLSLFILIFTPSSNALITFSGVGYPNYGFSGLDSVLLTTTLNVHNLYPTYAAILGLTLLWTFNSKIVRGNKKNIIGIIFLAAILSGSRSGIIGFFAIIIFYSLIRRNQSTVLKLVFTIVTIIVLLTVFINLDSTSNLAIQARRTFSFSFMGSNVASDSIRRRFVVWSAILKGAEGNPITWLMGQGVGSYLRVVGKSLGFTVPEDAINFGLVSSHSLFFDAFLVIGILGLLVVIAMFIVAILNAVRLYRMESISTINRSGEWLLLLLIYVIVTSIAGGGLNSVPIALPIILTSVIASLANMFSKDSIMINVLEEKS